MRNYQSIVILKPDLDETQVTQSIEKITSTLTKFGGSILKLEQWGKKRLAYRVRKSKFGFYLNIYHTCEQGEVPNLEKSYQLYDQIIKYLVIRLNDSDVERVMSKKEPVEESSSEETKAPPAEGSGEETKVVAAEEKAEETKVVATEEKAEETQAPAAQEEK